MTWYKIHLASKQHVQQLSAKGAVTPFMKMLIMKYDKIIPWKDIKTPGLLLNYVSQTMLPNLYGKIDKDSADNYYLKDVDVEKEYKNNPNDQIIHTAFNVFQTNAEGGKEILLNYFNEKKKDAFQEWKKVVDGFSPNPCFMYCVLEAAFKTSDKNITTACIPVEYHLMKKLHDLIENEAKANKPIDFGMMNKYMELADSETFKVEYTTGKDGWILIPSKSKCHKDKTKWGTFEQNLRVLRRYGKDAGWCVGQDNYSLTYLSGGDFYLLTTGGRARVAIRMEETGSTNSRIGEVRGRNNIDDNLMPYWEQVVDFIGRQKLDSPSAALTELKNKIELNKSFETNENARNATLNDLLDNPKKYSLLNRKNRTGEAYNKCVEGWKRKLEGSYYYTDELFREASPEIQNNEEIIKIIIKEWETAGAHSFLNSWRNATPTVKTNTLMKKFVSEVMQKKIIEELNYKSIGWGYITDDLKTPAVMQAGVNVYKGYLANDKKFNPVNIPPDIAKHADIQPVLLAYVLKLRPRPFYRCYSKLPIEIKNRPEVQQKIQKKVIPNIIKGLNKQIATVDIEEGEEAFRDFYSEIAKELRTDAVREKAIEYVIKRSQKKVAEYKEYMTKDSQARYYDQPHENTFARDGGLFDELTNDDRLIQQFIEEYKCMVQSNLSYGEARSKYLGEEITDAKTGGYLLSVLSRIPGQYLNMPEIKQFVAPMQNIAIVNLAHDLKENNIDIAGAEEIMAKFSPVFDDFTKNVHTAAKEGIAQQVIANPGNYSVINDAYKSMFNNELRSGWIRILSERSISESKINFDADLAIPPEIRNDPEIRKVIIKKFVEELKDDPNVLISAKDNGLTVEEAIIKDKDVIKAFQSGRMFVGGTNPENFEAYYESKNIQERMGNEFPQEYHQISPEEKNQVYEKLVSNLVESAKEDIRQFYRNINSYAGVYVDRGEVAPQEFLKKALEDERLKDAILSGWAKRIASRPHDSTITNSTPRNVIENPRFIEYLQEKNYVNSLANSLRDGYISEDSLEDFPEWVKNIPGVSAVIKEFIDKRIASVISYIKTVAPERNPMRMTSPLIVLDKNVIDIINDAWMKAVTKRPQNLSTLIYNLPNRTEPEVQRIYRTELVNQMRAKAEELTRTQNVVPPVRTYSTLYNLKTAKTLWKLI